MSNTRAAIRYAKAALALAQEQKSSDAVEADMLSIVASIQASVELADLLASPTVESTAKENVLLAVFGSTNQISQNLIKVLISNKRIDLLEAVAQAYIQLSESQKDAAVVDVVSATELSAEVEKSIVEKMEKLTSKKISLNKSVDASLLGGFVLRVGDLQYNASVANQLEQLKRELIA